MSLPVILAHGSLGSWDEIIFLSVASIFLVMMGISWIRSRTAKFEDESPPAETSTDAPTDTETDRFRLE